MTLFQYLQCQMVMPCDADKKTTHTLRCLVQNENKLKSHSLSRVSFSGRTFASQANNEGSIPFTRSIQVILQSLMKRQPRFEVIKIADQSAGKSR